MASFSRTVDRISIGGRPQVLSKSCEQKIDGGLGMYSQELWGNA